MPTNSGFVDVLILTALSEETFVLDKMIGSDTSPALSHLLTPDISSPSGLSGDVRIVRTNQADGSPLCIAWACVKGMGNVRAYDRGLNFIEAVNPRAVIMLGLAGAKSGGPFCRGDVGYARRIGYCSFGKISATSIASLILDHPSNASVEQRGVAIEKVTATLREIGIDASKVVLPTIELRQTEDIPLSREFELALRKLQDHHNGWQDLAKKWFTACNKAFMPVMDQKFETHEIPESVVVRIEKGADPIAVHLRGQLPELPWGKPHAKEHLAAALNSILDNAKLVHAECFASFRGEMSHDDLSPATDAVHITPQKATRRTNRVLLEKAFPELERKEQRPFENPRGPIAQDAIVASGEAVVASGEFQRTIAATIQFRDDQTKDFGEANLFEMEGFGLAQCCRSRNIPFALVKGVSDLADKSKTDAYRLSALSSATAATLSVALSPTLLGQLIEMPHYGWPRTACPWTTEQKHRNCVLSFPSTDNKSFVRKRPCSVLLHPSTEVAGARVLEGVESTQYSMQVIELAKIAESILLVFPYSADGLLTFLRTTDLRDEVERLATRRHAWQKKTSKTQGWQRTIMSLTRGDAPTPEAIEMAKDAVALGESAHNMHGHFSATNRKCAELIESGNGFFAVAKKACRIVYIPNMDCEELLRDPAYLMHVAMCGVCVPTLLAKATQGIPFDEATFVSYTRSLGGTHITRTPTGSEMWTCLKYMDESKFLMIFESCQVASLRADAFRPAQKVYEWLDMASPADSQPDASLPSDGLSLFPVVTLLEKYGYSWASRLQDPRQASLPVVKNYFAKLRDLEKASNNLAHVLSS